MVNGNSYVDVFCGSVIGTTMFSAGYEKESKRLGNDYSEQTSLFPPFPPNSSPFPPLSNPSPVYEIWGCISLSQSVCGVSGNLGI